ncbi:hypothetical protein K505DRAFT_354063 [Melanomma pulvis-pyrius CBS 109.77]|uniref:AMP-dependent synthetase/ligase domain-containing protein n=1 Tax=Melanomma pulvis-pyrius CBS 109.77 TaxID=1314802 RepID=A0A6A6WSI4_9PLEO|nr:hypothetical protein K505DRAFT_354063 [Melanomma pulvis-pyrius CBS 109.77]
MFSDEDVAARLLVAQIEEFAAEPLRIWASILVDDENLAKDFQDVKYTAFANAINRAASWLQELLPPAEQPFETVTYSGPKDIRHPILAVAVAKVGRKLLFPSPFASIDAQAHLVQASACRVFMHDKHHAHINRQVLSKTRNKSIMIASLDASELIPDAHEEMMNRYFQNRPTVVFIGPPSGGPTRSSVAEEVIRRGKVQGVTLPPALIDSSCESSSGLEWLLRLEYVYFVGAPLSRHAAEKLLGYVPDDWKYYSFQPGMGLKLQYRAHGLHEAVFVFQVYPELQAFSIHELFTEHLSKSGFWRYVGRTDDLVPFSHGENLYAANIESEMTAANPDISTVHIGGKGRHKRYLFIRFEQFQTVLDNVYKWLPDLVMLFTRPSQPLVRTIKGAISRWESEELYENDIE